MKITDLISECTAYDFKLMLEEKKPKSWLNSVSAFANGLGGSLFLGIDNSGVVKCLDDIQSVCETIWMFEKADNGQYYIKNVGTGLYVGTIPTRNDVPVSMVEKAEAGTYLVEASAYNGCSHPSLTSISEFSNT